MMPDRDRTVERWIRDDLAAKFDELRVILDRLDAAHEATPAGPPLIDADVARQLLAVLHASLTPCPESTPWTS